MTQAVHTYVPHMLRVLQNVRSFKVIKRLCSMGKHKFDGFADEPDPNMIKNDYIGPPDKYSNLRPYIRSIPKDESFLAFKLRSKQIEVEKWNQLFWTNHNKRFYEEKQEFVKLYNQSGIHDIPADKISEFYKSFLDKNQKMHILYNISWYIKNFEMLMLAFQVAVQNFYRKLKY